MLTLMQQINVKVFNIVFNVLDSSKRTIKLHPPFSQPHRTMFRHQVF